jgi:prefoldin beta subunit
MVEKHEHQHEQPMSLPPAAQTLLIQLQTFQQQYQTAAMQHEALTLQKLELDKALEELGKVADKEDVFKAVGPILVKSTKAGLAADLTEKREAAEARLKSTDVQLKKLREKMGEIQGKLQSMFGRSEPKGHVEGAEEGEEAG